MIAYFCSEYSLDSRLKTYAGGLGILAGDTVKEMGDAGDDFVAIGLYYYKGYLAREYDWNTPESANLRLITHDDGRPLNIIVPIGQRDVSIRLWEYKYKSARVIFLDTMVHTNHPNDQKISYFLYDQDIHIRLAQEMVLGIGGIRALKALGIYADIYHMNEGHSVFLSLELPSSTKIVFTNHTVVPEGNHMYKNEMVAEMFQKYLVVDDKNEKRMADFLALGRCQYEGVFSLTNMAVRVSKEMNGVSKLHTRKLVEVYPEKHVQSVTNGIHVATWLRHSAMSKSIGAKNSEELLAHHKEAKKALLLYIRHIAGVDWSEKTLILGWGRRFIKYKRPLAMFGNILRLWKLLKDAPVDIGIVISGIPHPKDNWANNALDVLLSSVIDKFEKKIVYLPNYSEQVSKIMAPGCDVWVNTPIVGLEACGTSGMKASLNGTLQLSTKDGWLDEVDMSQIGWELEDRDVASSFYDILERMIIPEYISFIRDGVGSHWATMMETGHKLILKDYSASRMREEYFSKLWDTNEKNLSGLNTQFT
jgi:glycogen phosphorylase